MSASPLTRAGAPPPVVPSPPVAPAAVAAGTRIISPDTGPEPTVAPPGTGPGSGSAVLVERAAAEAAANLHQQHLSLIKQAGRDNSPAFAGNVSSHNFNPDGSNDPHQSNRLGLAVQQTAEGKARRAERWRDQGFGQGMHLNLDQKRVLAKALIKLFKQNHVKHATGQRVCAAGERRIGLSVLGLGNQGGAHDYEIMQELCDDPDFKRCFTDEQRARYEFELASRLLYDCERIRDGEIRHLGEGTASSNLNHTIVESLEIKGEFLQIVGGAGLVPEGYHPDDACALSELTIELGASCLYALTANRKGAAMVEAEANGATHEEWLHIGVATTSVGSSIQSVT